MMLLQTLDKEQLERAVSMTNQTNLVAIDKAMACIRRIPATGFIIAAVRCGSLAEKLQRYIKELEKEAV